MDPWVWLVVGVGLVLVAVVGLLLRSRGRRREALKRQAAFRAQQASMPPRPTKELVDLALKQREEALVERRRQMEAAALEATRAASAPPSAAVNPRRTPVIETSPIEIPEAPSERAVNPVQKMALEQWEDVNIVRPAAKPTASPTRAHHESFAFQERPASKSTGAHGREPMLTRSSKPGPAARKGEPDSFGFTERPGAGKKQDPILDADWGHIEVRRDVKRRDPER